jgi:glycosyltransferase involved in cell wall biosynthesis
MTRGKRSVVVAGLVPRFPLERRGAEDGAALRLIAAFNAGGGDARARAAGSPVRFGGLPIVEREFVDALLAHGTFDEYCIVTSREGREATQAEVASGAARRLVVRTFDEAAAELGDDVILHSTGSNVFNAVATREQLFPSSPFHLFLSGLSDPHLVVPSVQLLLAAGRGHDMLTPLSASNRLVAQRLFEHVAAYYEQAWGVRRAFAGRFTRARMGVDLASYARDEAARSELRALMQAGAETTVFLFVGRLGASEKADLLPLASLFRREFVDSGRDAVLILAGHDDGGAAALIEWIARWNAGSRIKVACDVTAAQKRMLYSAADVFVSPSDNLQEAFGVALIEAMAAGLPVIASDWNGYRDSVEHGVSGLLVPTYWNEHVEGMTGRLGALRTPERHLLYAQNVCVDLAECARAMQRLAADRNLRQELGRGASRAARRFDWSEVVAALETDWNESLELARRARDGSARRPARLALYGVDIASAHRHYPTGYYSDPDVVSLGAAARAPGDDEAAPEILAAAGFPRWPQGWQRTRDLLASEGPQSLGDLVEAIAAQTSIDRPRVRFQLLRMVKYGLLTIDRPNSRPSE